MQGPLSGLRIIDLTHFLAGPFGSMLLADLGAETIKVEAPREGEGTRALLKDHPTHSYHGMGAYFLTLMRNKKSVAIDLKKEAGRQIFYDLVKVADIVFDNFKPGTLEKLGADYATIKKYNPKIISCSLTGYGQTGPHRDQPAFDLAIQARGGGMSMTGEKGGEPVRAGIPIGDLGGGIFAAVGILAAVYERERTGRGKKLDLSMLDVQISLLNYMATIYNLSGFVPQPIGSEHDFHVPYGIFKAQDMYIAIAIVSDGHWKLMCEALGLEDLGQNETFNTRAGRATQKEKIDATINERLSTRPGKEWLAALYKKSVPAAPVNTMDRALSDDQVLAREMVIEMPTPYGDKIKMPGSPFKYDNISQCDYSFPPTIGQHTNEVLTSLLNYPPQRIQELSAADVIEIGKPPSK